MSKSYRVSAPYVTLMMKDQAGGDVLIGFYEGAVVSSDDVNEDSLQHHLDGEMVEEVKVDKDGTVDETAEAKKNAAAAKKAAESSGG
jgi:hypothetical protein